MPFAPNRWKVAPLQVQLGRNDETMRGLIESLDAYADIVGIIYFYLYIYTYNEDK
jgi:hypothetical protein